jgi:hypothetical protein
MTCQEWQDLFNTKTPFGATAAERGAWFNHLDVCPACRKLLHERPVKRRVSAAEVLEIARIALKDTLDPEA